MRKNVALKTWIFVGFAVNYNCINEGQFFAEAFWKIYFSLIDQKWHVTFFSVNYEDFAAHTLPPPRRCWRSCYWRQFTTLQDVIIIKQFSMCHVRIHSFSSSISSASFLQPFMSLALSFSTNSQNMPSIYLP